MLILGGGFAGLAAALALRSSRHDVTLVDRRPWFEFLPNIHELLSGVKTPELLRLPLERTIERAGHRFVRDTVMELDCDRRRIVTRRRRAGIGYDVLIVALGGVDATRGVPGVVDHAMPFRSVAQCDRIGKRLDRLARRRKAARVVIVGGGLEGVEALGEILRRHRGSGIRVTLVEARDRLLPEAPAALDAHVRELCAPYPIAFALRSSVRRVEPKSVVLHDGRCLPSDLTIWTGGPAPPALLTQCGLAPAGAWAPVEATLQSEGHPEIFVVGDAAQLPTPLSKQGYHALDMGACAARNAQRLLAGRSLARFRPSGKPTLVSFGDLSCFLVTERGVLAGPLLAIGKEAVFELVMTQLDAGPLWRRLQGEALRAERAARTLLWPNARSLEALCRSRRIGVLGVGSAGDASTGGP